jgi:twinkle protein
MASFEMAPVETLARMLRQCWGVRRPEPEQIETFARWSDGRLWLFDHLGRLSPERMLAACSYFADALKGRHVVIDSLMMVCESEEHLDQQKQLVTDLVRVAQERALHIHLVAHARKPTSGEDRPPTKYDLRGSAAITDQCANVITVWQNKARRAEAMEAAPRADIMKQPECRIGIEKQRNGEFEGSFALWFDDNALRFMDDRLGAVEPYAIDAGGEP